MGRRGLVLLVIAAALAFAGTAQAKPLLGITGDLPHFQVETGQQSTVHQAFLGWGQGISYGSSLVPFLGTLTPIPMIHLGTADGRTHKEAITPAGIAAGKGDAYLFGLNQAIAQWGKGIYVRPMAEMNDYVNKYSGFTENGAAKPQHSPTDYRRAFARIYLILHGGSASAINAKLKALGEPPIAHDLASNPFPRLRVVWSPLAGGNPHIPANAPPQYYPGTQYVDVDAGDIFDEKLVDTAPWNALEDIYKASVVHGKPFAIPEWGLFGLDDDKFVQHMCSFLTSHTVEEAGFYESKVGTIFDLDPKPKSKKVYRDCITPLGAAIPAWAAASQTTTGNPSTTPTITFTLDGQPIGSVSAPLGADEIELDIVPATGVITKAYWIRGGKAQGSITVPAGATGAAFATSAGGAAPTPIIRPRAGTDFHVKWNASGVITSAWWTRVGKLLAQIPVTSGETSIAMSQGP
ncbi:MAG: hypothetical protein ACRDLE_05670 [Gaiellaceae bacterium]